MKVPKDFTTRIAGNYYRNTPNLLVWSGTPILSVDRDRRTGELKVKFAIYDAKGRRRALVRNSKIEDGSADDYAVSMTESNFEVRDKETGRTMCKLQRCRASRDMDLDAFVLTHAPDGFFIHASPVQTNLGTPTTGETYRNQDSALEFQPRKQGRKSKK